MKKTIKRRIFSFNLVTIALLLVITAIAFNVMARSYLEKSSLKQLEAVASQAVKVIYINPLHGRPGVFVPTLNERANLILSYVGLMRALRVQSSTINADYALMDANNNVIAPYQDFEEKPSSSQLRLIQKIVEKSAGTGSNRLTVNHNKAQYAAVLKPIRQNDGTKTGTIIIYSNLDKINKMQNSINLILLAILLISAIIVMLISNALSKEISKPLSALCSHIRSLSEMNFSSTLHVPADNEIQELVQNINIMAGKLDTYNKSQKLFLQNASHEFRTPIMSIQCHAEGILHGVVESPEAAKIILDESKRLTHLVEELLYLSRLDAIEETYRQDTFDVSDVLLASWKRMRSLADSSRIELKLEPSDQKIMIKGDFDKLERCLSNILSNGIRYAQSKVNISLQDSDQHVQIIITDDGPGFDKEEEAQIFNRFYKGKKGNTGLGLAISKSIVEKHKGTISAKSTPEGASFCICLPKEA